MPKKIINQAVIKQIASKYMHSVTRSPAKIPNIQNVITEALRNASPNRPVEDADISTVINHLSQKNIVNDKIIAEAAKKVANFSAMSDLKHLVKRHITQLGMGSTQDVEDIIKKTGLDPHNSTMGEIRQAVQDFYKNRGQDDGNPKPSMTTGAQPVSPKTKVKQGEFVGPVDPKNKTFFEKIRLKLRRYGIKQLTRGSRNWLTDNVNKMTKPPARKELIAQGKISQKNMIGSMFMYFYDAKTKEELPYWDKFPLIFVIEIYKDGWLGLNLHYLPIMLRAKLFDKLLQFANNPSLDQITKLKLSYQLLSNVSRFPEVRPTIKRYLSDHVMSRMVKVEPIDWEIAIFLPVEQFQKKKKEFVWAESKKKIQKYKTKR